MISPAYESFVNDISMKLYSLAKKEKEVRYTPSKKEIKLIEIMIRNHYSNELSDIKSKLNGIQFVTFINAKKFIYEKYDQIEFYFKITSEASNIIKETNIELLEPLHEIIVIYDSKLNKWEIVDNRQYD